MDIIKMILDIEMNYFRCCCYFYDFEEMEG